MKYKNINAVVEPIRNISHYFISFRQNLIPIMIPLILMLAKNLSALYLNFFCNFLLFGYVSFLIQEMRISIFSAIEWRLNYIFKAIIVHTYKKYEPIMSADRDVMAYLISTFYL